MGLAICGLDSACWGLREFRELFSAYSADEKPVFELVEVMVFVDRSMIGAFGLLAVVAAADVDVGEGELDDAL